MMGYKREGDTVTLTMTQDDYESVLLAMAIAAGVAMRDGAPERFRHYLELANRVNAGHPYWTPYKGIWSKAAGGPTPQAET